MKKLNLLLAAALLSLQSSAQTTVCNYLCNPGFDNTTPSVGTVSLLNHNQVSCWETTASDGKMEIWGNGYWGVPSYSGSQFLEINATQSSTVYQKFTATPGTVLSIGFAHRGRAGVDVMKAEIGPVGGPYTLLGNYSDGTSWTHYTASYTVPPGVGTSFVLRFTSVSWAGGNPKIGNFLDAVSMCGIPGDPDNPPTDPPTDPPVNQCDQCKDTDAKIELFQTRENGGTTAVSFHLNSGGRVITKIRVTLLNFRVIVDDPACKEYCNMDNPDFGHFISGGAPMPDYPMEFAPYNPNDLSPDFTNQIEMGTSNPRAIDDALALNLKFPPIKALPGCSQKIEACFRIEMIDENCVVCERMICTEQTIDPKSTQTNGGQTGARILKVFPNPNGGSFTINTSSIGSGCGYQLVTLEGKEVKAGRIEGLSLDLSNDNLSNGTYLLYVFSGNETFVEKVVVAKN